ncbi:hypothetical protein GGR50DRAFT_47114 [Xylaria sp. CBS 124048]|nr:hypothetical protein GGR50DRAFT_47114 [Xylaria sp. CBS 124048]
MADGDIAGQKASALKMNKCVIKVLLDAADAAEDVKAPIRQLLETMTVDVDQNTLTYKMFNILLEYLFNSDVNLNKHCKDVLNHVRTQLEYEWVTTADAASTWAEVAEPRTRLKPYRENYSCEYSIRVIGEEELAAVLKREEASRNKNGPAWIYNGTSERDQSDTYLDNTDGPPNPRGGAFSDANSDQLDDAMSQCAITEVHIGPFKDGHADAGTQGQAVETESDGGRTIRASDYIKGQNELDKRVNDDCQVDIEDKPSVKPLNAWQLYAADPQSGDKIAKLIFESDDITGVKAPVKKGLATAGNADAHGNGTQTVPKKPTIVNDGAPAYDYDNTATWNLPINPATRKDSEQAVSGKVFMSEWGPIKVAAWDDLNKKKKVIPVKTSAFYRPNKDGPKARHEYVEPPKTTPAGWVEDASGKLLPDLKPQQHGKPFW